MDRKKKLKLIQISLLFLAFLIIYYTYYNKADEEKNKIVSTNVQDSSSKISEAIDTFTNVEYTGLDLNGNRYLLKSKEAYLDEKIKELIYMKTIDATFYFKDDTILYIEADKGVFNNKTLDMKFDKNVKAKYLSSELFAEKAEYLNTKNYLKVYENVRINDIKGNLIADKLIFDITKQTLDITSLGNGKINANVNLDEKRF